MRVKDSQVLTAETRHKRALQAEMRQEQRPQVRARVTAVQSAGKTDVRFGTVCVSDQRIAGVGS